MTRLVLLLLLMVLVSGALAITLWKVINRAVENAFDWFTLTFGNEDAVRRLRRERGWDQ